MNYFLFQQINQWADQFPWLDKIAIFCADNLGYLLLVALGIFFLFGIFKKRKYLKITLLSLFAAILSRGMITPLIRWSWYHPRPFVDNQVNLLLPPEAVSSFPSGHVAFYFAISFLIYFYNKKAGLIFLIASFLIGFARIYGGIHYPLDMLGGILVAFFSAWIIKKIF